MEKPSCDGVLCQLSLSHLRSVEFSQSLLVETISAENSPDKAFGSITYLCLASIPDILIPREVVKYFEPFLDVILSFRIVKHLTDSSRYVGLIAAQSSAVADIFSHSKQQPLSSLLDLKCDLRLLSGLVLQAGHEQRRIEDLRTFLNNMDSSADSNALQISQQSTSPAKLAAENPIFSPNSSPASRRSSTPLSHIIQESGRHISPPSAALTIAEELICSVCLEPFDKYCPNKFTTFCQHSFHLHCINKLENTSCPVCRYVHDQNTTENACECAICGYNITSDLWICLVCGFVGCGSSHAEHNVMHYEESLHTYAMHLENHAVYDFTGQGYVDRLVLAESLESRKMKLSEISSPHSGEGGGGKYRGSMPQSDQIQDEIVHRKLEDLGSQYSRLLAFRMQQNKLYYEDQIARIRQLNPPITEREASSSSVSQLQWMQSIQHALQQDLLKVQRQVDTVNEKVQKLRKENAVQREGLIMLDVNQEEWKKKAQDKQKEYNETKAKYDRELGELRQRVQDMMAQLEATS